jgi:hypothetical protein
MLTRSTSCDTCADVREVLDTTIVQRPLWHVHLLAKIANVRCFSDWYHFVE